MVTIRCDDISPVHWAYVSEYARKRRIERCDALQKIIEEHALFVRSAFEERFEGVRNVSKKKANKAE